MIKNHDEELISMYEMILDEISDVVMVLDRSGLIVSGNKAPGGSALSSFLHTSILQWLPPEYHTCVIRGIQRCLEGEHSKKVLVKYTRNPSGLLYYSIRFRLLKTDGSRDLIVSIWSDVTAQQQVAAELQGNIVFYQQALEKLRTMTGVIPICATCKKIRNEDSFWLEMELFLSRKTNVKFSHTFCPDCAEQFQQEFHKKTNIV